ncbi:MAG: TRAM domain-containing protein [Haloarculaceae archaeon]
MSEIPASLRLLYEAPVEADGDRYVVTVPNELVENGSLTVGEAYRVALLAADGTATSADAAADATTDATTDATAADDTGDDDHRSNGTGESSVHGHRQGPPVEEGEVRSVAIDTLGDQGDGIAKVERGFIVIVPDTQPGDQVKVRITDVKDTVAFAEAISEPTVR